MVLPRAAGGLKSPPLRVSMLGPFSISLGERSAGPWPRPTAKRLCELVLVSPGRRITRERACEELFPNLAAKPAHNAVARALSLARAALSSLGEPATSLLQADRNQIWAHTTFLEVDVDSHQRALKLALVMHGGNDRDQALTEALFTDAPLLGDEPDAEWAHRPRERLESARQEARLALARDRARGLGRSSPEAVVQAWEDCLSSQPTCEEAACALVRLYSALGRRPSARATYRRCRAALEDLGLAGSPALEEAHAVALPPVPAVVALAAPVSSDHSREELRLVSVLCAELSVPYGGGTGPEELKELLSGALANLITQVEAFGGTVASVSGAGVEAVFGAPMAHEDDPERAVRAAHRVQSDRGCADGGMTIRIGIETGPAVVGRAGPATRPWGRSRGPLPCWHRWPWTPRCWCAGHPGRRRGRL